MKKIILLILIFFLTISPMFAYEPYLQKGTLIKVYTKVPLSTQYLEEGSEVYFIAPQDVWILENKAIAKGDIFYGYVSSLNMPVRGVNASMKINITRLVKQDGEERYIKGKIRFSSSDVLGGNLTNPASYNQSIHPRKVYGNIWGGTLQYVPSGEYEFGNHVKVTSKDLLFVELLDDYYLEY